MVLFGRFTRSMHSIILQTSTITLQRNMSSASGVIEKNISISLKPGVIENKIRTKLQTQLDTKHLVVVNESYMHNVPKDAETHFKVVAVSDKFEGMTPIKRHRLIHDILKEELQTGVHALSILAKTPNQWEGSDKIVESSPNCRGGFGK